MLALLPVTNIVCKVFRQLTVKWSNQFARMLLHLCCSPACFFALRFHVLALEERHIHFTKPVGELILNICGLFNLLWVCSKYSL